jgi:hypothetical protein
MVWAGLPAVLTYCDWEAEAGWAVCSGRHLQGGELVRAACNAC